MAMRKLRVKLNLGIIHESQTVVPTFPSLNMRMLQMWHLRLGLRRHHDYPHLMHQMRRYRHD